MSFVRDPSDVERLLDELKRLGDERLGVVLKIETRPAFEHLPQLVLTAMQCRRVGVMIARGTSPSSAATNGWPSCRRRYSGCARPRSCR